MCLYLVTGGSGFLGSAIVRRLHQLGKQVRSADVFDLPDRAQDTEFVYCDIRDKPSVKRAMDGVGIVYHNAAMVPLTRNRRNFVAVNVNGTKNVVEAAIRAGVDIFVHMSSSAVYGIPEACPITDDTLPRPAESYGRSKLQAERIVQDAMSRGLAAAIVRPRTIIGRERLGIFQILFEWIREGRRIYILGDGSNRMQFVHVEDLVEVCVLCAEKKIPGIYHVGTERFGSLREDLESLIEHAGTRSRVWGLPAAPAKFVLRILGSLHLSPLAPWHYLTYDKSLYFDISSTVARLDWHPRYSNSEMLVEAYDWFVKSGLRSAETASVSVHRKGVQERLLRILRLFS
jgi:nucleoside-diphosphate-sugar epimerase